MSYLKLFDDGYDLVVLRAMIDAGAITLKKTPVLKTSGVNDNVSIFDRTVSENTRTIIEAHEAIKVELARIEEAARLKNKHETELERLALQKSKEDDIPF